MVYGGIDDAAVNETDQWIADSGDGERSAGRHQ